jgi:hypothetical protein
LAHETAKYGGTGVKELPQSSLEGRRAELGVLLTVKPVFALLPCADEHQPVACVRDSPPVAVNARNVVHECLSGKLGSAIETQSYEEENSVDKT